MKESKHTARSTVEAGLMSVIIFILLMITAYVPVIGFMGSFVLPIPITLLYLRHNRVVAILAVVVSSILIGMFNNPLVGIAAAILYGLSGLGLGFCVSKGFKSLMTLAITSVANMVGIIVDFYISMYLISKISLTELIQQLIDALRQGFDFYKGAGIDVSNNPTYQLLKNIDVNYFLFMIPAVLIASAIIISLLNYIVAKMILKRFNYNLNPIANFKNWYLDNRIGALMVCFVCIGIIIKSRGIFIGDYILSSSMAILQLTLTVIGISIVYYYLKEKFNVRNAISIVICIFIAFSGVSNIAMFVGLIDLVFDIRGLDPNSLGNALRKKFMNK